MDLKIVSDGGVVDSQHGPVIAILRQYAHMGSGRSIHSSIQLEAYGLDVNDKSRKIQGGAQRIVTPDGYIHPLQVINGLTYVPMCPFTDKEWDELPHVIWTADQDWDPAILDSPLEGDKEEWFDALSDADPPNKHLFDEVGNYRKRSLTVEVHSAQACATNLREPDFTALHPHFGYSNIDTIKRTFQVTTQLGRLSSATHLKRQFCSPTPALNVH